MGHCCCVHSALLGGLLGRINWRACICGRELQRCTHVAFKISESAQCFPFLPEADAMDESLPEEVLLDANREAKAYEFYTVGEIEVSTRPVPRVAHSTLACLLAMQNI
jgi:hypothetical protein